MFFQTRPMVPKYPKDVVNPLVMTNIANWKNPLFLMGKSTISTGPFSIAMLNYQRVNPPINSWFLGGYAWWGVGLFNLSLAVIIAIITGRRTIVAFHGSEPRAPEVLHQTTSLNTHFPYFFLLKPHWTGHFQVPFLVPTLRHFRTAWVPMVHTVLKPNKVAVGRTLAKKGRALDLVM